MAKGQVEEEKHSDGPFDDIWVEAMSSVNRGFHLDDSAKYLEMVVNVTKPYKIISALCLSHSYI